MCAVCLTGVRLLSVGIVSLERLQEKKRGIFKRRREKEREEKTAKHPFSAHSEVMLPKLSQSLSSHTNTHKVLHAVLEFRRKVPPDPTKSLLTHTNSFARVGLEFGMWNPNQNNNNLTDAGSPRD